MSDRPVSVFLVCPGLGHVTRGYETFTRECFDALRTDPRLEVRLYKGAGPNADRDRTLRCFRRTGRLARLADLLGDVHHDAYYVEQATFTAALLPHLAFRRPDVVLFSDPAVGHCLWWWRRATGSRFKLLLSNGGPIGPPAHPRFDHVHQVSPVEYEKSALTGRSAQTQTLIPYGFNVDPTLRGPSRDAIRHRLAIPVDRPVVLSVGVVNRTHKRMDYVVREVAALPVPRPFLVLLGQADGQTPAIVVEANRLLGPGGFRCASVPAAEMADYYAAADAFVLASLSEGFGRVLVEALAHGLPVVAHDGPVQRHVVGTGGTLADLERPGALAALLGQVLAAPPSDARRRASAEQVAARFGWDAVAGRYAAMIMLTARGTCPTPQPAREAARGR